MIEVFENKDQFLEKFEKVCQKNKEVIKNYEFASKFVEKLKNKEDFRNLFLTIFDYDISFSIENAKKMFNVIQRIKFTSNKTIPFEIISKNIIGFNINNEDNILNLLENMKEAVLVFEKTDSDNNFFLLNAKTFHEGFLCDNYEEIILFFQYYFPSKIKHFLIYPPNLSIFGLIYKNFLKSTMQKIIIVNDNFDFSAFPDNNIIANFFKYDNYNNKNDQNNKQLLEIVNNIQELQEENENLLKFNSSNGNANTILLRSKTIKKDKKSFTKSNTSIANNINTINTINTLSTNINPYIIPNSNELLGNYFSNLSITSNINNQCILGEKAKFFNNNQITLESRFSYVNQLKNKGISKNIVFEAHTTDKGCDDYCLIW